jgi:glycerate dehydrogenase
MKIIVLDGATMNPGDLEWRALQLLGDCTIYDRTPNEEIVKRCHDAEIVITNKIEFSKDIIEQLPKLKYIGVSATGYNVVDTTKARAANIIVTNVPAYSTMSVAQMVFAHILNLTHHVAQHSQTAKNGKWAACKDFAYWDIPLVELSGMTVGIIGLGRIGSAVARIAQSFGMEIFYYDKGNKISPDENMEQVDLDMIFSKSDFISLHCPLTDETQQLVNRERLNQMKPTAFLINTSRGPLMDEIALADALNNNRIAGAGIDVLSIEPPAADNPLLSAKNCTITPHIAWATKAARQRLMDVVVENVQAFLNEQPQNVVS